MENISTCCPSWLESKLLIDLMLESVHPKRRPSPPLSLLELPVDSVIRKRSNSIGLPHFHCLAGNSIIIFQQFSLFQFAKSLLTVDLQLSEVLYSHAGYVAHNMNPFPAVYQKNI